MAVYALDPLRDPRWSVFVGGHPSGSVFHTAAWLRSLNRTYGYEPLAYTTTPPGMPLNNGVVVCRVMSWLTGRRLVSVPFADHCSPLCGRDGEWQELTATLRAEAEAGWCYVELRPRGDEAPLEAFQPSASFILHVLDLRASVEELLARTHPSMIQRAVRRARREGVVEEKGRSEKLLQSFARLMLLTRRRHGLPPQPIEWFRHLLAGFEEQAEIRLATVGERPVASILTLRHGTTVVYKYGCSDAAYHRLGAMPFLLWSAIADGKSAGMEMLDLGRSDVNARGLIAFKERWGARAELLTYWRHSRRRARPHGQGLPRAARALLARMPDSLLALAGKLAYRHMG